MTTLPPLASFAAALALAAAGQGAAQDASTFCPDTADAAGWFPAVLSEAVESCEVPWSSVDAAPVAAVMPVAVPVVPPIEIAAPQPELVAGAAAHEMSRADRGTLADAAKTTGASRELPADERAAALRETWERTELPGKTEAAQACVPVQGYADMPEVVDEREAMEQEQEQKQAVKPSFDRRSFAGEARHGEPAAASIPLDGGTDRSLPAPPDAAPSSPTEAPNHTPPARGETPASQPAAQTGSAAREWLPADPEPALREAPASQPAAQTGSAAREWSPADPEPVSGETPASQPAAQTGSTAREWLPADPEPARGAAPASRPAAQTASTAREWSPADPEPVRAETPASQPAAATASAVREEPPANPEPARGAAALAPPGEPPGSHAAPVYRAPERSDAPPGSGVSEPSVTSEPDSAANQAGDRVPQAPSAPAQPPVGNSLPAPEVRSTIPPPSVEGAPLPALDAAPAHAIQPSRQVAGEPRAIRSAEPPLVNHQVATNTAPEAREPAGLFGARLIPIMPAPKETVRTSPAVPEQVAARLTPPAAARQEAEAAVDPSTLTESPERTAAKPAEPDATGVARRKAAEPATATDGPALGAEPGKQPAVLHAPESRTPFRPQPEVSEAKAPESAPARSPMPEQPKPAVAKDIRLQVTGGDQRVEIRLTERSGEVRVAVRTPDTQLANRLQDQLPSLSSRLEQSGYRAEPWQPAAATANESPARGLEPAVGGNQDATGGDPRRHPQQQQGNPEPRRPRLPEEDETSQTGRKEFSWFVSNLQ